MNKGKIMDLKIIKEKALNLKKVIDDIIISYNNVIKYLVNIYNIVSKYNPLLANKIKNLINIYNDMIKKISENYQKPLNDFLLYINNTINNLSELESSIANINRNFTSNN